MDHGPWIMGGSASGKQRLADRDAHNRSAGGSADDMHGKCTDMDGLFCSRSGDKLDQASSMRGWSSRRRFRLSPSRCLQRPGRLDDCGWLRRAARVTPWSTTRPSLPKMLRSTLWNSRFVINNRSCSIESMHSRSADPDVSGNRSTSVSTCVREWRCQWARVCAGPIGP